MALTMPKSIDSPCGKAGKFFGRHKTKDSVALKEILYFIEVHERQIESNFCKMKKQTAV
jgi:hypothetical protein